MSSKRNKLMVERAQKGISLAPFSKTSKRECASEHCDFTQQKVDEAQSTHTNADFVSIDKPIIEVPLPLNQNFSSISNEEDSAADCDPSINTISSSPRKEQVPAACQNLIEPQSFKISLPSSLWKTYAVDKVMELPSVSQLSMGKQNVQFANITDIDDVSQSILEQTNLKDMNGNGNTRDIKKGPVTNSSITSLKLLCLENINSNTLSNQVNDYDLNSSDCVDFSAAESEDEYIPIEKNKKRKRLISSSSSSSSSTSSSSTSSSSGSSSTSKKSTSSSTSCNSSSTPKKGKKRTRNVVLWQKNKRKALKDSGKAYTSARGKLVPAKQMKPPCTNKCRLSCSFKFNNEQRIKLFNQYWGLYSFQRQRDFLSSCITIIQPAVRRIKAENVTKPRKPNACFNITDNGNTIRVCKQFLVNTFGIGERTLRTIIETKTSGCGVIPVDSRGKHSKHLQIDPEVSDSVREHINSIPRVESHYLRANTSREFIDGGLTIAELHRNYKSLREPLGKTPASYDMYARIFNSEFNISFFIPKKDQCDICEAHKNAVGEDKVALQEPYDKHQKEKKLSRIEKTTDIEACVVPNSNTIVAIYDLQAVMPTPLGESSAFFYKSKLNCYNFTVCDLKNKSTDCYFWHEGIANRGAIEIGTCVFKFLQKISISHPDCDIIFFSDNCSGQQKNRFVFSMYHYAVSTLPIKSITHKFLIRGHTQNEGDTAHSIIEKSITRAKKSGPIYVPSQYVQIIRSAKKTGKPFTVHELDFDDFIDLKALADDIGLNVAKDEEGNTVKVTEVKCVKFLKSSNIYFYKTSYDGQSWKQVPIKIKQGRSSSRMAINPNNLQLKPAYQSRTCITGLKKKHLSQLIDENIVPKQYKYFYDSLF